MTRPQLLALAIASTVIAALGLGFIDVPVARWIGAHEQSSLWEPAIKILEYPAGISPSAWIAPIVLTGGVLVSLAAARWRRHAPAWMYLAIVYLLTRNLMGWGKTLTGRYPPIRWLKLGGATFGHVGEGFSFPSGHVVVFAGLILPLALIAPRTRPLLVVVAFIMVARLALLAHFVSDVFASLALTAFVAWACAPIVTSSAMTPARAPARR